MTSAAFYGLTMSLACLASGAHAAMVGYAPTARGQADTASQYVGIIDQAFPTAGEVASSFSFYNANPASTVVPVLFLRVGDTFTVSGIGTASTGQVAGPVSAAFGLTSGSDVVTTATYGGFESFGDTISFDYSSADPGTYLFTGMLAVGSSFVESGSTPHRDMLGVLNDRNYSFSITSVPAVADMTGVPEPASLALLAAGLVGVAFLRPRRRTTSTP